MRVGFDRLLCGLVCALLWCEAGTSGGTSMWPAELRALQQLYNATGGPQGAWLNAEETIHNWTGLAHTKFPPPQ